MWRLRLGLTEQKHSCVLARVFHINPAIMAVLNVCVHP